MFDSYYNIFASRTDDHADKRISGDGVNEYLDEILSLLERAQSIAAKCDRYTEDTSVETEAEDVICNAISAIEDFYVDELQF